jgi:hypothetical protein
MFGVWCCYDFGCDRKTTRIWISSWFTQGSPLERFLETTYYSWERTFVLCASLHLFSLVLTAAIRVGSERSGEPDGGV